MDKVDIKWHDLDDNEDELKNFSGFYAIVALNVEDEEDEEVDLLYIGMSYQENMQDKIDEPHLAYDFLEDYQEENPEMELFFMIGVMQESTLDIMSKQFFSDIECLLIDDNEPLFNKPCTHKSTDHRRDLEITNSGDYEPLEEISRIEIEE